MSLKIAPEPAAKKSQLSALPGKLRQVWSSLGRGARFLFSYWIAKPDTLLLVVLASVLRLSGLNQTTFLADQAGMYSLGLSAIAHHALPVTGIRSSIGTLNMPASILLLLPFILLGDPDWGTLATAVVNIGAVLLLYALANHYVGRRTALVAGFLYATAPWAVFFSRFIWQQNLLAPVVLLLVWFVCRGVIDGRRGWLGWSVLLWGIALQLHPSAAPLITLIIFGWLLTWRTIRWRDLFYSGLALAVLFLPSLAWEIVSKGSDVTLYVDFAERKASYSTQVLHVLYYVLTPPRLHYFGDATLYYRLYPSFAWVTQVLGALYAVSVIWLLLVLALFGRRLLRTAGLSPRQALRRPGDTWRAFQSLQALQRLQQSATRAKSDGGTPASSSGRNARGIDARFLIIMLLWQVSPILSMLKPPKAIQEHYLLVILPALFLMIGIFLVWLEEYGLPWMISQIRRDFSWFPAIPMSEVGRAFLVVLAVITAAQVFASVALNVTLQESAFTGPLRFTYTHYGFPLEVQQDALATAYTTAKVNHERLYVATTGWQQQSLGYLAAETNTGANVYDAGSCLTMPATGSAPAVVLATEPLETTNSLATMPGVTVLRTLGNPSPPNLESVTDTPALTLYSVPAGSHLHNEVSVPVPATSAKETHLVAYANTRRADGAEQLVLHWSGAPPSQVSQQNALDYWYGAQPQAGEVSPADYWFMAQPLNSASQPVGGVSKSNCSELFWGPRDDVYSWINLQLPSGKTPVASWRVWVMRQTMQVARPVIAGISLETADVTYGPNTLLPGTTTVPASK